MIENVEKTPIENIPNEEDISLSTEKDIEYVLSHGGNNKSVYTTGRVAKKLSRSSRRVRLLYEVQPSSIRQRDASNVSFNLWVDPSELFVIDLSIKPFDA